MTPTMYRTWDEAQNAYGPDGAAKLATCFERIETPGFVLRVRVSAQAIYRDDLPEAQEPTHQDVIGFRPSLMLAWYTAVGDDRFGEVVRLSDMPDRSAAELIVGKFCVPGFQRAMRSKGIDPAAVSTPKFEQNDMGQWMKEVQR